MGVWFVIYCKSKKDEVAEQNLKIQGFEVYRPLINKVKSLGKAGVKKILKESLFPRYLFLKANPEEKPITDAAYTSGVVGFVKFGGSYSTVDETVIDNIKKCESLHSAHSENNEEFKKGDSVYINGEGFSDIKATFCESRGDDRVIVLLQMLGRMSTITVPSHCLSKSSLY